MDSKNVVIHRKLLKMMVKHGISFDVVPCENRFSSGEFFKSKIIFSRDYDGFTAEFFHLSQKRIEDDLDVITSNLFCMYTDMQDITDFESFGAWCYQHHYNINDAKYLTLYNESCKICQRFMNMFLDCLDDIAVIFNNGIA